MTAVAAWDRGGTMVDRTILVAMSVVIVLAVHLLPALSRRPASWLVWMGCLLCAIYGHLTFFTHASLRAGDKLAQQSSLAVSTDRQIEAARDALAAIKARPVATVAAELATSTVRRERAALREELAEGKRAETIRENLVLLSGVSTTALVSGAADPVTARLSIATGWSESAVAVAVGMTFSILLELIGALVWYEALRPSTVTQIEIPHETADVTPVTNHVTNLKNSNVVNHVTQPETYSNSNDVTILKRAIQLGKCKGTVRDIQKFFGCAQNRAQELRKELRL
jgi:hypothetical protein